jgi:hypothetical protein
MRHADVRRYVYSQSAPRERAITERSGGATPNQAFASFASPGLRIGSPTFSAVNMRLSFTCASVRPSSVRPL